MSGRAPTVLDRLRDPEYTGANRCLPCTVANVVLAAVVAFVVARVDLAAAAVVLFAAFVVIYLRGYLVPGTPALTERLLPERVLAAFEGGRRRAIEEEVGNEEETEETSWATVEKIRHERAAGVEPATFLADVGAVESQRERAEREEREEREKWKGQEEAADRERRLTAAFEDRVDAHLEHHGDDPSDVATLAQLFDANPSAVTVLDRDYPAVRIDARVRSWPSEGALALDVATDRALAEQTERWSDVPVRDRQRTRRLLRSYRERCPSCGGELVQTSEPVPSCCRTGEVVATDCADCGQRILEGSV